MVATPVDSLFPIKKSSFQLEELISQDCLADGSLLNTEQTLAILEILLHF